MMNPFAIAAMFLGLSEEAGEQALYFWQRYENAYYEASNTELGRLADFANAYHEDQRVWKLWANVWANGFPANEELSMAE